jgi:FemAB-related protein (PEP-CTERM system-associated)
MTIPAVDCSQPGDLDVNGSGRVRVICVASAEVPNHAHAVQQFVRSRGVTSVAYDLRWLQVLQKSLGHAPWLLKATIGEDIVGVLPLGLVSSVLFGRYLVGLPYLNSGGVLAANPAVAKALLDRAIQLADELEVRHLELRHETAWQHSRLTEADACKVQLRLLLPGSSERLWSDLKAKVRNQVRKAEKCAFQICWGKEELLADFYDVFSRNMRDLGTPVYGRLLFREILSAFAEEAELCVLRLENRPVAAALLLHAGGVTEVPSASSLRQYSSSNANMLMYWHLLCRAIGRGQQTFDFGRSSEDSGTYRFKRQWGAVPEPTAWQYYVRRGQTNQMRPESGKYDRLIRIWRWLPLPVTRLLGPAIVRGIP